MAYTLALTADDLATIAHVGNRYCWSSALLGLDEGDNILAEHEAWKIKEAFDADMEGGHDMWPMLDGRSELADKLATFYNSII